MQSLSHPIHYTSTSTSSVEMIAEDSELLKIDLKDFGVRQKSFGSANVYFTNSIKASRFVLPSADQEIFAAEGFTISDIWKLAQSSSQFEMIIDPCMICGHKEVIQVDKNVSQDFFIQKIKNAITSQKNRVAFIKSQAKALMSKCEFGTAFDMLQVSTQHLDCSDPEGHYLIGICAQKLRDEDSLFLAEKNLEVIDGIWLEKLHKAMRD